MWEMRATWLLLEPHRNRNINDFVCTPTEPPGLLSAPCPTWEWKPVPGKQREGAHLGWDFTHQSARLKSGSCWKFPVSLCSLLKSSRDVAQDANTAG